MAFDAANDEMTPNSAAGNEVGTPVDLARVREAVRRVWGFSALRPMQEQAIQAGLSNKDSLVVLPTGGGKSLCYQVPPLVANRTDLVVSPLISLMKDQVDGLREVGYPAVALYSGLPTETLRDIERNAAAGRYRLVFVAPERLVSPWFLRMLENVNIGAFAIDEAHCISHWGHDFRPEYRQLAVLKEKFPRASLHAYTATATQRVQADILAQLRLNDPTVLVGRFDRPNLVYRVVPRVDLYGQTLDVLRRHEKEAVIIYCISRRDTEDMAGYLQTKRIRAAHYHAGMDADDRRKTQDDFAEEKLDVVVATVAFGMGIDRSDVRCVIHAAMPKSVEHYQQETGRAGRDGLPAECVLFYSAMDPMKWESILTKGNSRNGPEEQAQSPEALAAALQLLGHIQQFCTRPECRHRTLTEYFGQTYEKENCEACDACLGEIEGITDATVTAQKILSCVARTGERFGVGHVVDVLMGANTERVRNLGHDRLSTYGLLKSMDKEQVRNLTYQLLDQGLLDRTKDEMPVIKLNAASWRVMRGQQTVRLMQAPAKTKTTRFDVESWEGVDSGLFESLRILRREIAAERGVPPFVVFGDKTLRDLARRRPASLKAMQGAFGVGEKKLRDLGARFVEHIRAYCERNKLPLDAHAASVTDTGPAPRHSAAKQKAFELFAAGQSIDEVAAAVGRARSTTSQYLVEFVETRRPARVDPWVDARTYKRVADAAVEVGAENRLKPIYDHLQEQVPYEIIRIVLSHLAAANEA